MKGDIRKVMYKRERDLYVSKETYKRNMCIHSYLYVYIFIHMCIYVYVHIKDDI